MKRWAKQVFWLLAWRRKEENQTRTRYLSCQCCHLTSPHFRLSASSSLAGWWWLLISLLQMVFLCAFGSHPLTAEPCGILDIAVVISGSHRLFKKHCSAVVLSCSLAHLHRWRQNMILRNAAMWLFALKLQTPTVSVQQTISGWEQRGLINGNKLKSIWKRPCLCLCSGLFWNAFPPMVCACLHNALSAAEELLACCFSDSYRHTCSR